MAESVLMIALSPTMEEGTIVNWRKKEGDEIGSGDVLCEVETDKATMDYESTQEGTLLKVLIDEGKGAKVGQPIAIIGEKGEDIKDLVEQAAKSSQPSPAGKVEATAPPKGPETGTAAPSTSGAREPAAPGMPKGVAPGAASPDRAATVATAAASGAVKSSPLARKIAEQRGIDIRQVPGTGPEGRVVKADVESFTGSAPGAAAAVSGGAAGAASSAAAYTFRPAAPAGQDQQVPVTGKRAVIARRVAESMAQSPHFYVTVSVEMENAIRARTMLNAEVPNKVSFNAFFIKFVAEALKRYPNVNSSWQGDHILQYGSIDIALAVDLGNGLMMPIVRNCGNRGIVEIDQELKSLIQKAGAGSLKPEEYQGATFSISNLGSFGVEEFTAIINSPAAAILALGETKKTPVVDERDQVVVRQVMRMTLSSDHRVIDGSAAARFMNELKRIMENPVRVLF